MDRFYDEYCTVELSMNLLQLKCIGSNQWNQSNAGDLANIQAFVGWKLPQSVLACVSKQHGCTKPSLLGISVKKNDLLVPGWCDSLCSCQVPLQLWYKNPQNCAQRALSGIGELYRSSYTTIFICLNGYLELKMP